MAPNGALDAVCLLRGRRWSKMEKCIVVRIVPWGVPVDSFRLIVSMLVRGYTGSRKKGGEERCGRD